MAKVSAKLLSKDVEKKLLQTLTEVLADIEDAQEAHEFAQAFFTQTELSIFSKRLAIAYFLEKKETYTSITKSLNVSTATISSVAEQMRQPGFKIALQKMKVQSWAKQWSKKLLGAFKSLE